MSPLYPRDAVNLVVYDNIQPIVWGTTVPFVIACAAFCTIRLYTRAFIVKTFGLDDWFMVAVFITWIGQQYIAWSWTILGGGLHLDKVPLENVAKINVYLFAEEFYYLFLQFLIKFSFLTFYLRTLATTASFRKIVYGTMVIVTLQTVGTWIFYALQCIPIDAYFHPELYPDAVCIQSGLSYYLPTAANVLVDTLVYILPVIPISKIKVSLRRRLELIAIFTLGGATITVSSLRFIVLWQLANTTDVTYIFGSVTIVTTIEFAIAIITANTPGVAAFVKHIRGGSLTQTGGSHLTPNNRAYEMGNFSAIGAKRQKKGFVKVDEDKNATTRGSSEDELTPRLAKTSDSDAPGGKVWVQTQIKVETEQRRDASRAEQGHPRFM